MMRAMNRLFALALTTGILSGLWGWVAYALCILGNFPFMLIQRYNRPRLVRLYKKISKKPQ